MTRIAFYELSKLSYDQRSVLLTRPENDLDLFLERVKPVIEDVRIKGDAALVKYAAKFDKAHFKTSEIKEYTTEITKLSDINNGIKDVLEDPFKYLACLNANTLKTLNGISIENQDYLKLRINTRHTKKEVLATT